jgi:hypothetical protein
MKKSVLIGMILVFLCAPAVMATLSCSVKSSCAGDEVEMLGMSATTNGNAALPGSAYAHKVCCSGLAGLSASGGSAFLNLSAASNAHAGKITGSVLSATVATIASSGPTGCVYQASCPSQYICLASIEKDANAHVGDCNAYPTNKICCGCADISETSQPGFCTDGIDNDCDGLSDCADPECAGSVTGQVKDVQGNNVFDATIKILSGTTILATTATNAAGQYSVGVRCSHPSTFNIQVQHIDYATVSKVGAVVNPQSSTTVDFTGENAIAKADTCEADCTFPGSTIIHASCSGKNGCMFYDAQAAQACDNAQPGWTREYDANNNVVCPSGPLQPKSSERAHVQCSSEVCVTASSPVLYNGKQVKMVVVVASD